MSGLVDRADHGRELLFGVLALQQGFLTAEQFAEVMTLLATQPGTTAAALFEANAYLAPHQVSALNALVEGQLQAHHGDATRSFPEPNLAVERTLVLTHACDGAEPSAVKAPSSRGQERYVLVRELGRGGLGKVVLALDRDLMGREVAMKLMLDGGAEPSGSGTAPTPAQRFLAEAGITARLQHPNIVPVHELGTRPEGELYYTMPVITGRSLGQEVRIAHDRLARGEVPPERWGLERLRLLGAFQGLCHGISYAHARGVLHRDIKPANVMMGEHGETLVVDWGLARLVRGDPDAGGAAAARSDRLEGHLQALREQRGIQTVEGTVTGTPAYMSPEQAAGRIAEIDERSDIYSLGAVLFEILTGRPPFQGASAYEVLFQAMAGNVPDPRAVSEAPIPEDLVAACSRAMRHEKDERYATVKELLADVVLSIEGTRERERMHGLCMERLAAARLLVRECHDLEGTIDARAAAVAAARASVRTWEPIGAPEEGKVRLLALEQDLEAAGRRAAAALNAALVALAEALAFEPDSADARRELGEFHYSRMVKAEGKRDVRQQEFHRTQVALYDDGSFAARLRGDGTVSIATEPPGARARLFTYVEERWFLVPHHERALGVTPLDHAALPMGSYLCILEHEGHRPTRVPFVVGRLEDVHLDVRLYTDAQIGSDLVHVPGGPFVMGEDAEMRVAQVDDLFIGRFPVTFGEYCQWLDWLDVHEPAEVASRAPQDSVNGLIVRKDGAGLYVPFDPSPAPGGSSAVDPRLPVLSVSWHDAVAYLEWRSRRDGRTYVLPTGPEREKASRGADGRTYPWGNRFDATLCKMLESTGSASQPEPVGSYAADESPYGVRDVAGGIRDWCEDWYDERRAWKTVKGGSWIDQAPSCRPARRDRFAPARKLTMTGFRVAVRLRSS